MRPPDWLGADAGAAQWRAWRLVEQFAVPDDPAAVRLAEAAVRAVMAGWGSPEQDDRAWWSRSILATARHFQEGVYG